MNHLSVWWVAVNQQRRIASRRCQRYAKAKFPVKRFYPSE